jgi:hypothetical protein
MKNFVVMSMQKYSKEHINIIKQHNENRKNFGKDIQYLLDKKLDENVNFTFKTLEEMEEKRLNYLKKNNKSNNFISNKVVSNKSISYICHR